MLKDNWFDVATNDSDSRFYSSILAKIKVPLCLQELEKTADLIHHNWSTKFFNLAFSYIFKSN